MNANDRKAKRFQVVLRSERYTDYPLPAHWKLRADAIMSAREGNIWATEGEE